MTATPATDGGQLVPTDDPPVRPAARRWYRATPSARHAATRWPGGGGRDGRGRRGPGRWWRSTAAPPRGVRGSAAGTAFDAGWLLRGLRRAPARRRRPHRTRPRLVAGVSDIGSRHHHNEDAMAIGRRRRLHHRRGLRRGLLVQPAGHRLARRRRRRRPDAGRTASPRWASRPCGAAPTLTRRAGPTPTRDPPAASGAVPARGGRGHLGGRRRGAGRRGGRRHPVQPGHPAQPAVLDVRHRGGHGARGDRRLGRRQPGLLGARRRHVRPAGLPDRRRHAGRPARARPACPCLPDLPNAGALMRWLGADAVDTRPHTATLAARRAGPGHGLQRRALPVPARAGGTGRRDARRHPARGGRGTGPARAATPAGMTTCRLS